MQVGYQGRADRYTYIPLIGIFMIIAWAASELVLRKPDNTIRLRIAGAAACAVILTFAVAAHTQAGYWRSSEEIYKRALAVTQDNWFAHSGIGTLLNDEGKYAEAEQEFRKAVEIEPRFADGYLNLGVVLQKQGMPCWHCPAF
jgi:tetratricopeptide (TPR) repeat protein